MANQSGQATQEASAVQERYQGLDPNQVLSVTPLLPFHEVADIGAGTGYFTVPLGKHLFDGKVYALEESQEALDAIKAQLDAIRLTNVALLKFDGVKLPLTDGSLDGALIAFHLNQSRDAAKLLMEVHRCLRKGGWVVALEWFRRDMDVGPPMEQRLDIGELRSVMEEVGFRFTSRHDLNSRQYMLTLRK